MANKLIPGQTQIGTSPRENSETGEIIEFKVYYGNVLRPLIQNQIKHLPMDEYMEMLAAFLQSDEGSAYDIPSPNEIERASKEMVNREKNFLKNKNQKPNGTQRDSDTAPVAKQTVKNDTEEIEESPEELQGYNSKGEVVETTKITSEEKEMAEVTNPNRNKFKPKDRSEAREEDVTDEQDNGTHKMVKPRANEGPLNPSYEKLYRGLARKSSSISGLKIALITFIFLTVVSIGALVFLGTNFYKLMAHGAAEVRVNGEEYQIPLTVDVELEEGESKLYMFGVSFTNIDGQVLQTVVPFGQLADNKLTAEEGEETDTDNPIQLNPIEIIKDAITDSE